MTITGVISLIIGALMFYAGVEKNNNVEEQLNSVLNSGKANPGESLIVFGVIFIVIGIILIIVDAIKRSSESDSNAMQEEKGSAGNGEKSAVNVKICKHCGTVIDDWCVFCSKCGKENSNFKYCPNCSFRTDESAEFCSQCGAEFILYKYSLNGSSENEVIDCAFDLIAQANFDDARLLLNSTVLSESKNPYVSFGKLHIQFGIHNEELFDTLAMNFSKSEHYLEIMNSEDQLLKDRLFMHYENYRKNSEYDKACSLIETDPGEARKIFESLGDWKDSKIKLEMCITTEDTFRKKKLTLIVLLIIIAALVIFAIIITSVNTVTVQDAQEAATEILDSKYENYTNLEVTETSSDHYLVECYVNDGGKLFGCRGTVTFELTMSHNSWHSDDWNPDFVFYFYSNDTIYRIDDYQTFKIDDIMFGTNVGAYGSILCNLYQGNDSQLRSVSLKYLKEFNYFVFELSGKTFLLYPDELKVSMI